MKMKYLSNPKTNDDTDSTIGLTNTLHHAIGPFLLVGQFMGVLPVSGVREKDVTRVHFRVAYIGVAVTVVIIAFEILDLFLSVNIIITRGLKLYTTGPLTFSLIVLLGTVTFLRVALHWPQLIQEFTKTEIIFLDKSYETRESRKYSLDLRKCGTILLVGAVVEHSMYLSSAIYNNFYQINKCNLTVNFWENLFTRERLHFFSIIQFHLWMAPVSELFTISMTFTWNFIDIFLVLITRSLAIRFGQVNKRIRRSKSLPMNDEFWFRVRIEFMSLLDLLQTVDKHLSGLVLLSCANNLYFICLQVFQSFQTKANTMHAIYFWYSLTFVLARIFITMLSASSINDTSHEILAGLYEIPTDFWGVELDRFYEIFANDLISVSGKRFYFITRRMIFAMAGTVMTYELVLFDQVKDVVDHVDFCITKKV